VKQHNALWEKQGNIGTHGAGRGTSSAVDPRAEDLLRDMAFVLHLTRKVRQTMTPSQPCLESVAC